MVLDQVALTETERQDLLTAIDNACTCNGALLRQQDVCSLHHWLTDDTTPEAEQANVRLLRRLLFQRRYHHQKWVAGEAAEWAAIVASRSQSRL